MRHLYDTHFHLDLQKDKQSAINEIVRNQIYAIAVTNLPDLYQREVSLYEQQYIRVALGFHPELIHDYSHQIKLFWELLPRARYIGEVGLDFTDKVYSTEQLSFFSELVDRCRRENIILSIHSRKAVTEVLDIIGDNFKFKPILHWFTGSIKELEIACQRGFYFSVNSNMVQTKKFQQMIKIIPKERLLLETDSPFNSIPSMSQFESLTWVSKTLYELCFNPWRNFQQLVGG